MIFALHMNFILFSHLSFPQTLFSKHKIWGTKNQHPQMHHPSNGCYYLIVDELQIN